jgi:hypothetical protein
MGGYYLWIIIEYYRKIGIAEPIDKIRCEYVFFMVDVLIEEIGEFDSQFALLDVVAHGGGFCKGIEIVICGAAFFLFFDQ